MDSRIKNSIDIISFIIKDQNIENPKKLAEKLGFSRAERIYKILRGEAAVSRNLAELINKKYPQYEYDWLLTGKTENTDNIIKTTETSVEEIIAEKVFVKMKKYLDSKFVNLETEMESIIKSLGNLHLEVDDLDEKYNELNNNNN